jgi:hypothetical protein
MCGHGGPVRVRCFYQLTRLQLKHRALHRALRKAGFIGQHAQARCDRLPVLAGGAAGKIEVNQEGSRLLVMSDDIAHEHVENIIIDRNGSVEARHHRLQLYR